eukprot:297645_1
MAPMFGTVIVSLIVLSMGQTSGILGENVTISTTLGDIVGIGEDNYITFKSIPYTENIPIADYRFTESTIKTSHYENNVYDARHYRYACIQPFTPFLFFEQSEDCLTLNIFTPNIDINGTVSNQLLPVMVWIHGGSFLFQTGQMYNGKHFMKKSNVIFVSINYRLGGLGFLSTQSMLHESNGKSTGGMNGIYDQIIALQWINNYIQDYGGNPNKVTIFGESAGGFSVCFLTLIPLAAGLFEQAIIQSGHCSIPQPFASPATKEHGLERSLSAITVSGLEDNLLILRAANTSIFTTTLLAYPSVDGYLLQDTTHNMLVNNNFTLNGNKIMTGSTSMDTLISWPWFFSFGNRMPTNNDEFDTYLRQYIYDQNDRDLIKNTYYPSSDFPLGQYQQQIFSNNSMRWAILNADVCFKCSGIWYLNKLLNNTVNANDIDLYLYNLIGPKAIDYVTHGGDVIYLFPDVVFTLSFLGLTQDDLLSDLMIDQWVSFAAYGIPNSNLTTETWMRYDAINGNGMAFGTNNRDQSNYNVIKFNSKGYRNGVCDFWTNHIGWNVISELCMEVNSLEPTQSPTKSPTKSPLNSSSVAITSPLHWLLCGVLFLLLL